VLYLHWEQQRSRSKEPPLAKPGRHRVRPAAPPSSRARPSRSRTPPHRGREPRVRRELSARERLEQAPGRERREDHPPPPPDRDLVNRQRLRPLKVAWVLDPLVFRPARARRVVRLQNRALNKLSLPRERTSAAKGGAEGLCQPCWHDPTYSSTSAMSGFEQPRCSPLRRERCGRHTSPRADNCRECHLHRTAGRRLQRSCVG
jgi:hypothetical protein